MSSDNSAASGGILVILGIVLALGGVFLYTQYYHPAAPNITIALPAVTKE